MIDAESGDDDKDKSIKRWIETEFIRLTKSKDYDVYLNERSVIFNDGWWARKYDNR